MFILSGAAISWESKKQRTVALSTTEAEYMAIAEVIKEAIDLKSFLEELGFENLLRFKIFNDNQSAISLASNHQHHARTKHIKYHFNRDALKDETMQLSHVRTNEMIADVLTKGLQRENRSMELHLRGVLDTAISKQ